VAIHNRQDLTAKAVERRREIVNTNLNRWCRACIVTTALVLGFMSAAANAELIFGVTEQDILVTWDSSSPGTIISGKAITGLATNERVQAIDFRGADGQLYAIGTQSNLYRINTANGVAVKVNAAPFGTVLDGSNFGMSWNMANDEFRITSNARQNTGVDPFGTVSSVDGDIAYAFGDPNFGLNPNVTHSAHLNGSQPTFFSIDAGIDVLAFQNELTGNLQTIGSLGINIAEDGGFDISPSTSIAYAALRPNDQSVSYLYTINLNTGAATVIGQIGGGVNIRAMAVEPIPGPSALLAIAIGIVALRFRRRYA
jgi:hypothetical protein